VLASVQARSSVAENDVALTTQTYAEQLGRAFAEAARGETNIAEVWVSTRPGGVDVWVLTLPIDMETERNLHRFMHDLYSRVKTADFQVYMVNPRNFRDDGRSAIPSHSVQIPLHAA
jgi:hypothetical protein